MKHYNSSNPFVVALLATRNRKNFLLERSIPSIYAQTCQPDLIVVVDDGSDAGIKKLLEKTFPQKTVKIDYLQNRRTKKSAAGAWNSGIDHIIRNHNDKCESVFVAILDDDDSWQSNYLANAVEVMKDGAEVIATSFLRIEKDKEKKVMQKEVTPPPTLQSHDFLVGNPGIQGSNLIVRLDVLLKAGLFDEDLQSSTDRDLCIRLSHLHPQYQCIGELGVHHYACSDRPRLSLPGKQKRASLDVFYSKHAPLMSHEQKKQYKDRAAKLFGWKPCDPIKSSADKADIHEPNIQGKQDTFHLIIGFIADSKRIVEIENLLEDILKTQEEKSIIGIDVVIIQNSNSKEFDKKLKYLVNFYRRKFLRIHLFSRAQISDAVQAKEVIEIDNSCERLSISEARTVLQTYIYHIAKQKPGSVVWVLDDDMRLNPLIENGDTLAREYIPIAPQLKKMRDNKIDVAIGQYTGSAPIPPVASIRCQMVDLIFNLRYLSSMPKDEPLPNGNIQNKYLRKNRRDYYYDLSRKTDRLETPFHLVPEFEGETVGEALDRLKSKASRIFAGEQITRPLTQELNNIRDFKTYDALNRGGNSLIFDIGAFYDMPNIAPKLNGRFTQRSDTIWTFFQRKKFGRNVQSVPTATYQDRSLCEELKKININKIIDDIRGYAVFNAIKDIEEGNKKRKKLNDYVKKYMNERFSALQLSFYRIIGVAHEIRCWVNEISEKSEYAEWIKFSEQIEALFHIDVLRKIKENLYDYDNAELQEFYRGLQNKIDSHQQRMSKWGIIDKQIREQRRINGKKILDVLYPQIASFKFLGEGSEGICFTDGQQLFKLFDYCNDRDYTGYQKSMHELVNRWHDSEYLYTITSYKIYGTTALLTYPYEESEPYEGGHGRELVNLMVECLRQNIACNNINPSNLRVVADKVKLIDYGGDIRSINTESDDLNARAMTAKFQSMCKRAFLSWRWSNHKNLKAIMRDTIKHDFTPYLQGYDVFFDAVRWAAGIFDFSDPTIALVKKHQGKRFLDYGCGKGKVTGVLSAISKETIAYDPDETLIPRLQKMQKPGLNFIHSKDSLMACDPFDVIVCRQVACIIDDSDFDDVLKTMRTLIKDDGKIILGFCHPAYSHYCETRDLSPIVFDYHDSEEKFSWQTKYLGNGRALNKFHRPMRYYMRMIQRAGFRVISKHKRQSIDFNRFEKSADLIVLELQPMPKPDVTLLIKACAMEADTLPMQIKHLVSSLESPAGFAEIIVTIDNRQDDFLRQYCTGDLQRLKEQASLLREQGWVDTIIETTEDKEVIKRLNKKWFNFSASHTHAASGAQLTSMLLGFESCKTRYILHADLDVMIGRDDKQHDYLADMKALFKKDRSSLTVSFNIAHAENIPYYDCNDGKPVGVESRIGLIDITRIKTILPIPNALQGDQLTIAWHESLYSAIRDGKGKAWRGGSKSTWYVHPQNDKKCQERHWHNTIHRLESGNRPTLQCGEVEWQGNYSDWIYPKRNEKFIFFIAGHNVPPGRFTRCFDSVLQQRKQDWGAIVVDDASPHLDWSEEIRLICEDYKDKVTFIGCKNRNGLLKNMVDIIPYYCDNPESVIITLDADDCLIGDKVLDILAYHYDNGADMTSGAMLRTDKDKIYKSNFCDVRKNRSNNLWQHLRSFKQNLFTSIPKEHFLMDGEYIDKATDWAYMIPMAELAKNPVVVDELLYLYEPTGAKNKKTRDKREKIIAHIMNKVSLKRGG